MRRTREEIAKWNQMTALIFQTGRRHQTSPASLRGSWTEDQIFRCDLLNRGSDLHIWFVEQRIKSLHVICWTEDHISYLISELVLWARSTTKDYIRAEDKLKSISKSFISQVIIPQVMFLGLFTLRGLWTREPASSRVIYFILRGYAGTMC